MTSHEACFKEPDFLKCFEKQKNIFLPDLLRDIGEEGESVLNPHKTVENLLLEVRGELLEASCALGVQRDLVASIVVSENEPILSSKLSWVHRGRWLWPRLVE